MKRQIISFLLIAAMLLGLCACGESSYRYTVADTFDTVIQVICYTGKADAEHYGELAGEKLKEWHKLCDGYNAYADVHGIYELNENAGAWVDISTELAQLLQFGIEVYNYTDGTVNMMGGAVTLLWKDTEIPPADSDIQAALEHIDITALEIADGKARITDPAARIDVGAFAKGYAMQKVADELRTQGFVGLLSATSSVVAVGDKNGEPFAAGIGDGQGGVADIVYLEDGQSLSTSGTDQRYFEYQGKKYHHIIDMSTGYPADSGVAQASVTHSDAGWADALSTAALITGDGGEDVIIRSESDVSK